MKSIAQKIVVLVFLFVCAAWVLRGFQLAWIQTAPGAAATTQRQPGTAPADAATCQTTEPSVASPYLSVAHDAAVRAGVDPLVFTWQIFAESSFNPTAHNITSGAEGIAQFMPETAAGLGIDPWNPTAALAAAANNDAGHLKQFAEQAQSLAAHYGGNEPRYRYGLALAAYNAGPGATTNAWNQAYGWGATWPANDSWAWLARLPGETQRYVQKILGCW